MTMQCIHQWQTDPPSDETVHMRCKVPGCNQERWVPAFLEREGSNSIPRPDYKRVKLKADNLTRYFREAQRETAMGLAERIGVNQASRQTGISGPSIHKWLKQAGRKPASDVRSSDFEDFINALRKMQELGYEPEVIASMMMRRVR